MRTIKEPEVRKGEILDATEKLFAAKGYEATTVNDILAAVNIAKGTFYYYFKSKENVLDAIIDKRINEGVKRAEKIAASPLSPVDKFLAIIMAQKPQNNMQKDFNAVLHEKDNSKMHQKSITQYVIRLSPCLCQVVEEGIQSGLFSTPYPNESIQILLSAALVLFDDDFFQWTKKEKKAKTAAFLISIERTLGAQPGTFSTLTKVFD
jgi:AcrR family transcriptional regulator